MAQVQNAQHTHSSGFNLREYKGLGVRRVSCRPDWSTGYPIIMQQSNNIADYSTTQHSIDKNETKITSLVHWQYCSH